jgi:hypothetical protein
VRLTCVSAQGREVASDVPALLGAGGREAARVEANRWIKRLRLVRYGATSMRERFTYRGDSLWWFTEIYLHKMRRLDRAVMLVLALERARERFEPARIVLSDADDIAVDVGRAFAAAHHLPIAVDGSARPASTTWQSRAFGVTTRLARVRGAAARAPEPRPAIVAFVHTAFWNAPDPLSESYIGPVLDVVARRCDRGDLFFVGVGPRRNFRARRWWDPLAPTSGTGPPITPIERLAPRAAVAGSLALWRQRHGLARDLTGGDDVRAAGTFRGCDLWPVLQKELTDAACLQWPWSARAMAEAGAALDALQPKAVLTYAEAGGWGRALILEARRRQIRSAGLQHGFIYRHWLNYQHEADELDAGPGEAGFPRPDRTLVYDRFAADHLVQCGHFPPASVVVTGSARLDDLAARMTARRADRTALRARLGAASGVPVALLTAKFVEVRDVLPSLTEAVDGLPHVRLVIKPHPAETPAVYAEALAGHPNVALAPADLDLASLLVAADGLVTMNSTVAIDGLALDVPALVVGLPNNLSPFVEAGAMLGADGAEKIQRGLEALLYDRQVRDQLKAAAVPLVQRFGLTPDGHAAERTADEIFRMIQ